MLAYTTLLALALGLSASAQSIPATATQEELALVSAQFSNSGFNLTTNAGFGLDLDAKALLTVVYGFGAVENGQEYSVDQLSEAPEIYVTPAEDTAAWFNSSSRYTLALADASALGDADPEGNYRHFLANSETGAAASGSNLTFSLAEDGTVITSYAAPGPLSGSGTHRYAYLLFAQPENFQAPNDLSTAGTAPSHWSVNSYVEQTGLQLVAASFFTVQPNGEPTGSVATTQAVNTATLSVSSASASQSGSASSGTSSGAQPTQSQSGSGNGASSLKTSLAAGLLGVAGLAVAAL
ncbi:YbhB/YbcL family Raf kinase inhibitor-like protein [Sporobolomyces salmoneus]|uniref:YbhB/YbcL family Raf kinase inhibitor-like protein n=1 Tax=Sporobolomyces salmoneus TaxID=183962 RepID=UPI003176ECD3